MFEEGVTRPFVTDSRGTTLSQGDVAIHRGQLCRVLALWVDPDTGTNVTISPLSGREQLWHVNSRDVTLDLNMCFGSTDLDGT